MKQAQAYPEIAETRREKLRSQGLWQCPSCKGIFQIKGDFPALSRRDNATEICSNCGLIEALADFQRAKIVHK